MDFQTNPSANSPADGAEAPKSDTGELEDAAKSSEESAPGICNLQSAVLVFVIPFLDVMKMAYVYTAVPLHFLDSDWPLWQLGLLISGAYIPRVPISGMIARIGDWVCAPVTLLASAASFAMAVFPDRRLAVIVGVTATSASVMIQAHKGLCYSRFGSSSAQQTRVLRVFTIFDVLGYSLGAMLGGVLYDSGGFSTCALFQLAIVVTQSTLTFALPVVWTSFAQWFAGAPRQQTRVELPAAVLCQEPQQGVCDSASAASWWVLGACFVNCLVYVIEWSLYAVYFRQVYDWSGTWTGTAQMAGDLVAAVVLFAVTLFKQTSCAKGSRWFTFLFKAPFNISLLLVSHCALMVMLAQPTFVFAVVGQILMGTVFVFGEQVVQEMLVLYSFGSSDLYRKLVFRHYVMYCTACMTMGMIGLLLYEHVSPTAAFYVAALAAGTYASCFGCFFVRRLWNVPGGMFADLATAECELRSFQSSGGAGQKASKDPTSDCAGALSAGLDDRASI